MLTMQATIECVSMDVRQQVRQLVLTPPTSYAVHARLMPPDYHTLEVQECKEIQMGKP